MNTPHHHHHQKLTNMSNRRANKHSAIPSRDEIVEMENRNLDLYLQNCRIIQENERLRRIAQEFEEKQARASESKQKVVAPEFVKEPEPGLDLQLYLGPRPQNEASSSNAGAKKKH